MSKIIQFTPRPPQQIVPPSEPDPTSPFWKILARVIAELHQECDKIKSPPKTHNLTVVEGKQHDPS